MQRLRVYGNFVKVEHTLFSFPLILAGSFLAAKGLPELKLLILILLGGFGARTAALGLNRIIDRDIDIKNPRTRERELPSRKIGLRGAFAVTATGTLIYFVAAGLICKLALYLSPVPLIVFILYPYMKRFTYLCHFGVGLGLALAPLGGWVAVKCSLENLLPALLLSLFTFLWVSGFDIIYATLDEKFDRESGVYSLVSRFGKSRALFVSAVLHILAFLALAALCFYEFKSVFAAAFLIVTGLLLYLEHKKSYDVDIAFFRINILVGFFVFLFVISGLYLR